MSNVRAGEKRTTGCVSAGWGGKGTGGASNSVDRLDQPRILEKWACKLIVTVAKTKFMVIQQSVL